jgi:hypothetical protein
MRSELSVPSNPDFIVSLLDDSDRRHYTSDEVIAMLPNREKINAAVSSRSYPGHWTKGKPDRETVLGMISNGYRFTEPSEKAKSEGYGVTFITFNPTQRVYIETRKES